MKKTYFTKNGGDNREFARVLSNKKQKRSPVGNLIKESVVSVFSCFPMKCILRWGLGKVARFLGIGKPWRGCRGFFVEVLQGRCKWLFLEGADVCKIDGGGSV
jgi:hypothetical protein